MLGRLLRALGIGLVVLGCVAALFGRLDLPAGVPPWAPGVYPLFMAGLLVAHGHLLGYRPSVVAAVLVVGLWLALAGWQGYVAARQVISGLDYLVLSLALFAVAVLISLGKSGLLARWRAAWGGDYLARLPRPEPQEQEVLRQVE